MPAISDLPARVVDEAELERDWRQVAELSELTAGDTVAVYSRGRVREGIVEKLGRKNATVVYTTEGAWADAVKIAGFTTEAHLENKLERDENYAVEMLERAGDKPDDERIQTGEHSWIKAKGCRMIAAETRERAELTLERLELLRSADRAGFVESFVTVTRKSAPADKLFIRA